MMHTWSPKYFRFNSMLFLLVLMLIAMSFNTEQPAADWKPLFNGKDLTGWDTYIGPRYDETARKFSGDPIGLNNDPDAVYSVARIDGSPAIRISGQHFGAITSREEFSNYHLQVQFKWGSARWIPRQNNKRDSGILYHAVGDHGKGSSFWMCSLEFQVQEGDCGDFWGVAGATIDSPAKKISDNNFQYDPAAGMLVFGGTNARPAERASEHLIKGKDAEKPTGEWNTADIYVYGDTSIHVLNNVVVNKLYNSRIPNGTGGWTELRKGKIQLQSEGAEVYFRDIKVQSISKLPDLRD
jgi:hypothetical protein